MKAGLARRRLLAAIGVAAALPCAFAQTARPPKTVGLLTAGRGATFLAPALARHGWVEGRDVRYEVRQAVGSPGTELEFAL